MLSYSMADVGCNIGQSLCKLNGESGEECGRLSTEPLASREEETCPKALLSIKVLGYRTRDSGLAGAGHAAEPEYTTIIVTLTPALDVFKDLQPGSSVTFRRRGRILLEGIEGGVLGTGQRC